MEELVIMGDVSLRLLLDAHMTIGGDRVFHPATREEWEVGIRADRQGRLAVAVRSLLISQGDEHTLVDTGFGEEEKPKRPESLLKSLAATGLQPEHIRRVILTHAHGDHCFGNTLLRADKWLPTFPLAEYVVQEREVAVMRDADDEIWRTRFQPLAERQQLRLLDGETDINESLACWPTPGHTSGHQAVLVRSRGRQALHVGDLVIFARGLERPDWGPNWAWSRQMDQQHRLRIIQWAAENDAILILGHDPKQPWSRVEQVGERFRSVPAG